MTSGVMQTSRNFIIPYFVYLIFIYLSPAAFQVWLHRFFSNLELGVVDLKKVLLPLAFISSCLPLSSCQFSIGDAARIGSEHPSARSAKAA
jgi:hypothetical protein